MSAAERIMTEPCPHAPDCPGLGHPRHEHSLSTHSVFLPQIQPNLGGDFVIHGGCESGPGGADPLDRGPPRRTTQC